MTCDTAMIEQTAQTLFRPGTVAEMRILNTLREGTVSGYFNNRQDFTQAAEAWSGRAPAVYCTLNPCLPALLARSANRLQPRVKTTTADHDIVRRAWLPLDFDPVRPAGISSTDAEHTAALERAAVCTDWLTQRGWPRPVVADSGNGAHLLYRIFLANADGQRLLLKTCLEVLALYFSDSVVALDVSVFNAARIWKVYGTLACKGDDLPERPHRRSLLLDVPASVDVVTPAQLEAVAGLLPAPPKASAPRTGSHQTFDLPQWITAHGLAVASEGVWQSGGYRWVLDPCPWNPAHTNKSAFVVQVSGGGIAAGCHHNGCQGNHWHALRDVVEPGWDARRFSSNGTQAQPGTAGTSPPASPQATGTYSGAGTEFFDRPIDSKKRAFMAKLLGDALCARQEYRFTDPVLWVYKDGVYVRDEGRINSDCLTLLGPEWTSRRRNEATLYVQDAQRLHAWRDDQPCYLNVRNGLYDLTTGTLGPHTPTHFSVVQLPMDYNPDATCPTILAWLHEVTQDDDDMLDVLRAYLKAIVQGATQIQRVLEVVGPGGSGKGTYLRLAMALVGLDNTMATELKHLETSRFELASTRWKRLICITDADRYGGPINTLKALTGGDLLRMEEKNVQERREQTADGLVLIAANEEVQSSDYTSGLGRRRLTLYFTQVPTRPRDLLSLHGRTFHGEFVAELPGLLTWVLTMPNDTMYDLLSLDHQYRAPGLRASWVQTLLATNPLAEWAHGHLICEAGAITQVGVADKIDLTVTHHDPAAQKSTSTRETLYKNEATWLYPNYVVHMHQVGSKALALKRFAGALHDFLVQQLRLQGVAHTQDRYGSRFHGVRLRTAQDDAQIRPLLLEDDQDIPF